MVLSYVQHSLMTWWIDLPAKCRYFEMRLTKNCTAYVHTHRRANRRTTNKKLKWNKINVSNISFGMISPFDGFSPSLSPAGTTPCQPQMAFVSVFRNEKFHFYKTEPIPACNNPRSSILYYCCHAAQYIREQCAVFACGARACASTYRTSSTISLPNRWLIFASLFVDTNWLVGWSIDPYTNWHRSAGAQF